MQRVLIFSALLILFFVANGNAQVIDLYSRITDPRGIAILSVPDSSPTRSVCFHGDARWKLDSTDMSGIVAEDTGSGVITHIWSTANVDDSLVTMKLYIDDTLLISDHYREFFSTLPNAFRPPLDTFANGAYTWDVQIPYHHGFKWTLKTPDPNMYFAIMWHHVEEHVLPWMPLKTTITTFTNQGGAEKRLKLEESPWRDSSAVVISRCDTLHNGTISSQIIKGPGMIQMLRFQLSSYDTKLLDSTWLNLYWDHASLPSVHVPLKDFFLSPVNVTRVRAFQIHADVDSGFICYFPMPFFDQARIELIHSSETPLTVTSTIQYSKENIDRKIYGYFHADFSESNPTKYHVYHPVVHTIGRGRYIGMSFGVMDHPYAVFLEGDPIFDVDSNSDYHIRYTGGEDYFDAAWWFSNGIFTFPFSGYTDFIDQFYRFQYLDCGEFNSSFDFVLQPGGNADIYDHYRTVGYYYKHWTPFWASCDTIIGGKSWMINGAGYSPNSNVKIELGPYSLWAMTDSHGLLQVNVTVPLSWDAGVYRLTVAGETSPQKYYVIRTPAIRTITDTLPITLRSRDSLVVSGTCFRARERVSFYLDSIPLDQYIITDSAGDFQTVLRIPYLPDRSYLLVARGSKSGNATAQDRITITRSLLLEFEDMMPPLDKTSGSCWAENVSYLWEACWSKQTFVYFKPDTIFTGAHLTFRFYTDHPDTFAIAFHNSVGKDLGIYSIAIDNDLVGNVDGFSGRRLDWDPYPSRPISCGTHFLDSGIHTIRFICTGKEDSAKNYWIEPDVLVLIPTTTLPPVPGTILGSVLDTEPTFDTTPSAISLILNPNPVTGSSIKVGFGSPGSSEFQGSIEALTLQDELGRSWSPNFRGVFNGGQLEGNLLVGTLPPGIYYLRATIRRSDGFLIQTPRVRFVRE